MLSFVYPGKIYFGLGILCVCYHRHQLDAALAHRDTLHNAFIFDLANETAMRNIFGLVRLRIRYKVINDNLSNFNKLFIQFPIRFFFIVLTDASCWAPIIFLKCLAFLDFEFSADIYAWLVIFVLPLNAGVNPLLYTFSTPKYRDQIFATFSTQSFSKKQESTSHQGCYSQLL